MVTIPEAVERHIRLSPLLEEALREELINLSALARKLIPPLEEELLKPVGEGAVIMALRRLSKRLQETFPEPNRFCGLDFGSMTLRSPIVEFTFASSSSLLSKQKQLLHRLGERRDLFLTLTQGVREVTILLSAPWEETALEIFAGERLISTLKNLSAVTIQLSPDAVWTPGVHYTLLKELAWDRINVVEVVSTLNEFTILLQEDQVERAFARLKAVLNRHS